ncbi:MAG TPA: AAA family ATPase [Phenylobacterium sp.]|uniref:AAA family ATPase n=1 Tax=Phenylobacterium sp. TaxID=1871053 RepID=UPI002BCEA58E|nr:AAA family ATPase [Phenylobacterium sp.]HSV04330.1 AAA family ATPase [Phenylobacterium sp.]
MARIVVMSGYPAAGKSSLARALAARLGFTYVSKDGMLDVIFRAMQGAPGDHALSLRCGTAAWEIFWALSRAGGDLVLDSNIKRSDPYEATQLARLSGRIVELRCDCPLELAQRRHRERAALSRPAQRMQELEPARAAHYEIPLASAPSCVWTPPVRWTSTSSPRRCSRPSPEPRLAAVLRAAGKAVYRAALRDAAVPSSIG